MSMLDSCDTTHSGCLSSSGKFFMFKWFIFLCLCLSVLQEKYFPLGRAFLKQCCGLAVTKKIGTEIGSNCKED